MTDNQKKGNKKAYKAPTYTFWKGRFQPFKFYLKNKENISIQGN